MKKIICVAMITVVSVFIAKAQHTQFGVKAGLNSSTINIENAQDLESILGFHVGGLAHIHISPHFAVQPEIVYSAQGGETQNNGKVKLGYINVPVLAQYMFDKGFRLQTGPQVGFLTSAEVKTDDDVEVDIDDQYKSIDFAWVFGGGYLFNSGLGIDARYNLGLSNIRDRPDYEGQNRVFQVGLFYQFKPARRHK